jgi:response regulator RpfG family c-di-GMP phosphodiesterase
MSTATSTFENRRINGMGLACRPTRILIVDDEVIVREILARKLNSLGYSCECSESGRDALHKLAAEDYDLLLADVMMAGMVGVALLEEALGVRPDMAVILVTSVVDLELAVDSLKHGAYDYITKPFSLEEVTISVSRALEKRRLLIENRNYQRTLEEKVACRTQQLKEALETLQHTYDSTLLALGTALDSRDADTSGHSLRVTLYTARLARCFGLPELDRRVIQQGAALHDIGKIGVPDDLLRKPGKLSDAEWVLMRKHPLIGYRILSGSKYLHGAAQLVLHHHEKYDGSGYPAGLRGDEISLGARIFAIADTLDCMTSNRPFQAATSFESARDEITRASGAQFDPNAVKAFLSLPLDEWKGLRVDAATNASSKQILQRHQVIM